MKIDNGKSTISYNGKRNGTSVILNYGRLWEENKSLMCNLLLYLTNHKTQGLYVIDFETHAKYPILYIRLEELEKQQAKDFIENMMSFVGIWDYVKEVDYEDIDIYDIDLEQEYEPDESKFKNAYLKISYS